MKKLNNKKGFTIVELVIVIAVIGILAGVLIPTFSSVIDSANESSALQEAKATLENILAVNNGSIASGTKFVVCDVANDGLKATVKYTYKYEKNALSLVENSTTAFGTIDTVYVSNDLLTFDPQSPTHITALTDAGVTLLKAVFNASAVSAVYDTTDNANKLTITVNGTATKYSIAYTPDVSKSTVVVIPVPQANTSSSTETESAPAGENNG